jgi:hypothetical protein
VPSPPPPQELAGGHGDFLNLAITLLGFRHAPRPGSPFSESGLLLLGEHPRRDEVAAELSRSFAGVAGASDFLPKPLFSRSVIDFAALLEWADRAGAAIVALDLGVNTSDPAGRLVANVMASVAQWEREVRAHARGPGGHAGWRAAHLPGGAG